MIVKTIVEENPLLYSSFPTMTICESYLTIFYRQGKVDSNNPHGFYGKVKYLQIKLSELDNFFEQNQSINIQENLVFESQNEMDSIVSKLEESLYALGTRIFVKNKINDVFLSVACDCNFKDRVKVILKDVNLAAFYGKGFKVNETFVFSAYGTLKNEYFTRPLLIATNDFVHFELLSVLNSSLELMLNESSIIKVGNTYIAFSRKDTYPNYALYYSTSKNLVNWSKPEKLLDFALAPMAISYNDTIYVSFRDNQNNTNKISILNIKTNQKKVIDTYCGSLFDGGYTDLIAINDKIYVVYYTNNRSPFIKLAKISPF